MTKVPFKPPNMSNMTNEMIADELGRIGIIESNLKKLKEFYKIALKARMPRGQTQVAGESFITELSSYPKEALDQQKAKEVLEELGKLKDCMVESTVEQMRTETKVGGKPTQTKELIAVVEYQFPETSYQG